MIEATEEFNAADYARIARPIVEKIRVPILVGGTFFYLRALLSGLPEMPARDDTIRKRLRKIPLSRQYRWLSRVDPESAKSIAPGDRHRLERALEVWILSGRPISSWRRPASNDDSLKIALTVDRANWASRTQEPPIPPVARAASDAASMWSSQSGWSWRTPVPAF